MTERQKRLLINVASFWPHELSDRTIAGRRHLIGRIEGLCQSERERGLANDWTYDIARHRGLLAALERERSGLAGLLAAQRVKQRARVLEPA